MGSAGRKILASLVQKTAASVAQFLFFFLRAYSNSHQRVTVRGQVSVHSYTLYRSGWIGPSAGRSVVPSS